MNETLRTTRPFIDECGFVYVAGGGPSQECLRLNRSASRLWRSTVGRAGRPDVAALPPADQKFIATLLARGVLSFDQPTADPSTPARRTPDPRTADPRMTGALA